MNQNDNGSSTATCHLYYENKNHWTVCIIYNNPKGCPMKCSWSRNIFFYYELECQCPCLHFILTSNYDLGNNQDVLFLDLLAMWHENAQLVLKEFFPSCYTVSDNHISQLRQCKMNLSAQCNTDITLLCPISLSG